MRRVRHSVLAFWTTAAAIMSVIAADLCARPAKAEDWPTRPLTLVVPFSAGGSSDTIGRIIADGISSNLRQPVVVENAKSVRAGTACVAMRRDKWNVK